MRDVGERQVLIRIPRLRLLSAALVAVMLATAAGATACSGGSSKKPAGPEIGLLTTAVNQLQSTPAVEQRCEKLMTALSRDLAGGGITDDATLKSRRAESSSCFTTVRTHIQKAAIPMRQILQRNRVSEKTKYTPQQVDNMARPVAAAYTLNLIGNSLDEQIGRATSLVHGARLGVPLGAGPLYGITNRDEPVETANALLFLGKYRKLLEDTIGKARRTLGNSANGG